MIEGITAAGDTEIGDYFTIDESQQKNMDTLTDIITTFSTYGIDEIKSIDIDDLSDISITVYPKVEVMLGSTAELEYKIQFAAYALTNNVSPEDEVVLDATVPGKVYMTPYDDKYPENDSSDSVSQSSDNSQVSDSSQNSTSSGSSDLS